MEKIEIPLKINGLFIKAHFYKDDIVDIFRPFLLRLKDQARRKKRLIVFMAGAPGAGKSTLVAFLEMLAEEMGISLQAIGIDGFHHYDSYLKSHYIADDKEKGLLYTIKGAPCTFDVKRLSEKLKELKEHDIYWPIYDRIAHDPKEDAIFVNANIVLIEGNYLLLDDEAWRDLKEYADLTIYLDVKKEDLKDDLIKRKMQSGLSYDATLAHYARVDARNHDLIASKLLKSDIVFKIDKDRHITLEDSTYFLLDKKI